MTNNQTISEIPGRVLALDLGEKLVGVAVSDERLITIQRLKPLRRTNWKRLLRDVVTLIERFDAKGLVIGLPLRLDGTMGTAAENVTRLAGNFRKSVDLPVYLQDERLTSVEARESLLSEGKDTEELGDLIDSESAALILRDFLQSSKHRPLIEESELAPK